LKVGSILILLAVFATLAVYFFFLKPDEPPPAPPPQARPLVWDVDMNDLQHITINLPQQDKSEAFVKHADRLWYFDEPDGPRADPNRWGGGIPLILSGPEADRFIEKDATEERLAAFGFTPQPVMEVILTLHNDSIIDIEVGGTTLQGGARYVRLADSGKVYTVDASWHDVLARLVTEPPYPPPEEEE
jgi:hypothetical protein